MAIVTKTTCSNCHRDVPLICDGRAYVVVGLAARPVCIGRSGKESFLPNGRFLDLKGISYPTRLLSEDAPNAIPGTMPGSDGMSESDHLAPPLSAPVDSRGEPLLGDTELLNPFPMVERGYTEPLNEPLRSRPDLRRATFMPDTNPIEPFNKLSPAEAERLVLLIEECGEVIQAASKILRHGYESHDPDGTPAMTRPVLSNRHQLEVELGDVVHAAMLMIDRGDVRELKILQRRTIRKDSVRRYLHHQDSDGPKLDPKVRG